MYIQGVMSKFEVYNMKYYKCHATTYLQTFYQEDGQRIENTLKELFDLEFVIKDLTIDFEKDFFIYHMCYGNRILEVD